MRILCAALAVPSLIASAGTTASTTTTLTLTSGNHEVTTVSSGSIVTLKASVSSIAAGGIKGQVDFCDASAASCTDIHLVGTGWLTSAGTAVVRLRPGPGSHTYKAVFLGTESNGASASGVAELTVTASYGPSATVTTLAKTGNWGNYSLTATVTETGRLAAPTGSVSFLDTSHGNAVLGMATVGPSTPGLGWVTPQLFPIEQNVRYFEAGDFNNDGLPDLALVNDATNKILVLLGAGDGTFTASAHLNTGVDPVRFAIADFNGDGNQDLAVTNGGDLQSVQPGDYNNLTIFLGHGDGTFSTSPVRPATGIAPNDLAVGDFNNDGIPDIAVINSAGNNVTILLGNGDGTFAAAAKSPSTADYPVCITVGDFNRDGKADLAIGANGTAVNILLGNGDGTFTAGTSLPITSYGNSIATLDVNGDGILDLAIGNGTNLENAQSTIAIFLGNGDGSFRPGPSDPVVYGVESFAVGDINQDGKPDLITVTESNTVTMLLGVGDGTFTESALAPALLSQPSAVALGDFNGDGRVDVAVADASNQTLPIFLIEPTQTASTVAIAISPTQTGSHLVAARYAGDSDNVSSASGPTPLWVSSLRVQSLSR